MSEFDVMDFFCQEFMKKSLWKNIKKNFQICNGIVREKSVIYLSQNYCINLQQI